MLYVYDILLNFNTNQIIDFYDWETADNIYRIKKIPAFRVNQVVIKDILTKKVVFDEHFIKQISNKSDYKSNNKSCNNCLVLLCDNTSVIGLHLTLDGHIASISYLLPEDEIEVLSIIDRIELYTINYIKEKSLVITNNFLTRKEQKIKDFLIKELKVLYKTKDITRLDYYYFEYFNEPMNNNNSYDRLVEAINNNFNSKHLKLYELVKLSYQNSK